MSSDPIDHEITNLTAHIEGFDKSQDPVLWAKMIHNRANMVRDKALSASDSTELLRARAEFLEAVAAFNEGGEAGAAQQTLLNAAIAAQEAGEIEGDEASLSIAVTDCETIVASDEAMQNTLLQASAYNCLGNALSSRAPIHQESDDWGADLTKACRAYEDAITLFDQLGHEDGKALAKQSWVEAHLRIAELMALDGVGSVDGKDAHYYIGQAKPDPLTSTPSSEPPKKKGLLGRLFGRN